MAKRRRLCLLLGAGLAGIASSAQAQGPGWFDGDYVGELALTAVGAGDCTEPPLGALYPLTVSGGEVRFAYLPRFATTLIGRVGRDGSFRASARLKHGAVVMTGRIERGKIVANLASPSCNYTFRTR